MLLLDDTRAMFHTLGNMHDSCVDKENDGSIRIRFFDVILDRAPARAAGDDELMHFRMRFFGGF